MDEITQAARAYADRVAERDKLLHWRGAFEAGYTAGLERAAKECDRVKRLETKGTIGWQTAKELAKSIRTLAHPPKED